MSMKTKGVVFNMEDPHQKEMFEWCLRYTNFSSYVKTLIDRDMETNKKKAQK